MFIQLNSYRRFEEMTVFFKYRYVFHSRQRKEMWNFLKKNMKGFMYSSFLLIFFMYGKYTFYSPFLKDLPPQESNQISIHLTPP